MKKTINWGIIGGGNAAINITKNFPDADNSKLLALASKNEDKRFYFKNEFKIENIYSNYEDILNNNEIDIVYIALPHNLHKEWCIKSSMKKKNILVEKPAALSTIDVRQIIDRVKKDKVFFTEGLAYKFHPFFLQILSIIKKLDPENIISIKSSFGNDAIGGKKLFGFRFKRPKKTKRLFNPELGGGAIWDTGCYPVSVVRSIISTIFNEQNIEPIILEVTKKIGSTGVDEASYMKLEFNKIKVYVETSINKPLKNNIEIQMKNGKITIQNPWFPNHNSLIEVLIDGKKKVIKPLSEVDYYSNQIESISNLLIDGRLECKYPFPTFEEIYQNNELLEKWFQF
jgi:scyllo-inositol 2-dehydrogenase (NADP+)